MLIIVQVIGVGLGVLRQAIQRQISTKELGDVEFREVAFLGLSDGRRPDASVLLARQIDRIVGEAYAQFSTDVRQKDEVRRVLDQTVDDEPRAEFLQREKRMLVHRAQRTCRRDVPRGVSPLPQTSSTSRGEESPCTRPHARWCR